MAGTISRIFWTMIAIGDNQELNSEHSDQTLAQIGPEMAEKTAVQKNIKNPKS